MNQLVLYHIDNSRIQHQALRRLDGRPECDDFTVFMR
jgi:hypothetical protein